MISKVVIAAAGQGTRMKHLTKNKSKHMINLCDRPFLTYLLDNLQEAGFLDIILVVGFRADLMENCLREYGYEATVVNQFDILGPKEKEYGTLCPIKCVKDIVGKEKFLAIYGDNLYSVKDLKKFRSLDDDYNYLAGRIAENPEKYGVLITEGDSLKEIIEKPKEYVGNLVNTGLYRFTPDVFEKIPEVKLSPRGEYELTDAITLLAQDKKVKVVPLEDYWMDLGNPGDVIKLTKFLSK